MTGHVVRQVRRVRRVAGLSVIGVLVPALAVAEVSHASAPPAGDSIVVIDDQGVVAMSVPAGWVDVATAPTDFGNGMSPTIMASPDNEQLVNSFEVPGVLVTVPATPGTHEELLASFGLPEGCTTLVTEDFADATLTGVMQRGDDCAGIGAAWRTIVGDTADGRTVIAQGQAPSALGVPELNAALASVVMIATDPAHAAAGTSTPMVDQVDASGSITVRVPVAWSDVEVDPFDFGQGAAQPYLLASTDRQQFLDTFDAPGLGVTIPNWEATHEELLADFGLQQGCTSIEVVPYADGTLTGQLQRGSACGGGSAEWRAIVGDTADGLTIVAVGQAATLAGLSELEAAIGSIAITAEFGGEDPATDPTVGADPGKDGPVASTMVSTPVVGTTVDDDVFGPAPEGFVRVVDDTGSLTLLAPAAWTWIDTYELDVDGGKARILATSDLGSFQGDGDAGGALLIAEPYEPDPTILVDDFRRDDHCATNEELPYDDGTYVGAMWLGEQCGPAATGTWAVIVGSPADRSVTLRLHLRAAAGEDAFGEQVLSSFRALAPGTVAPAALPERIVPAGATPTDIAVAFFSALSFGDGPGACSLLAPERTGNLGLSVRGCAERIVTYHDPVAAENVAVIGESTTSEECSASESSDPAATDASVEFSVGADVGCVSMVREPGGEWGIEDYSGSLLAAD